MRIILTDVDPNRKITAIKAVRAATGLGLREAKECIDTVISGVPSVLENMTGKNLMDFRVAGMLCHPGEFENLRLPLDKMEVMKDLVKCLMDERQFKSAQYIIDAMEVLDE
jgi:hypothetical protein